MRLVAGLGVGGVGFEGLWGGGWGGGWFAGV